MPMLTGNTLCHCHTLFFRLVRQHRATHHVTHRPDTGQVGTAIRIHHNRATLIELQTHSFGIQANGIGHAANGDDQLVCIQRLCLTLGIGPSHAHAFFAHLDVADFYAQLNLQTLLDIRFLRFLGDLLIHGPQKF